MVFLPLMRMLWPQDLRQPRREEGLDQQGQSQAATAIAVAAGER